MNPCLMFCSCILRLDNLNTIQWFEWILSFRGQQKLAQIELEVEGSRIRTRDGYVPARIHTHDGHVPARICTCYGHVPAIIRTRNGYVPVTALQNVEAYRPVLTRDAYNLLQSLILSNQHKKGWSCTATVIHVPATANASTILVVNISTGLKLFFGYHNNALFSKSRSYSYISNIKI